VLITLNKWVEYNTIQARRACSQLLDGSKRERERGKRCAYVWIGGIPIQLRSEAFVVKGSGKSMNSNWYGIVKGVLGSWFPGQGGALLSAIKKKDSADKKNVPFCLTEEFAAVYRLHPLMPPGLVIQFSCLLSMQRGGAALNAPNGILVY